MQKNNGMLTGSLKPNAQESADNHLPTRWSFFGAFHQKTINFISSFHFVQLMIKPFTWQSTWNFKINKIIKSCCLGRSISWEDCKYLGKWTNFLCTFLKLFSSSNFPYQWIPRKLSFRYIFFHEKNTPNDSVTPQCLSQLTPKMKANCGSALPFIFAVNWPLQSM